MDPLDDAAQPRCPDCGVVMRDATSGWVCPSCSWVLDPPAPGVPPRFDGPSVRGG